MISTPGTAGLAGGFPPPCPLPCHQQRHPHLPVAAGVLGIEPSARHAGRSPGRHVPKWPGVVESWMGDSRGHWEGKTLVIETTNIKSGDSATRDPARRAASPLNMATQGVPPFNTIPTSTQAHTLERLTMVDPKTITYEITYTDPEVFTAPSDPSGLTLGSLSTSTSSSNTPATRATSRSATTSPRPRPTSPRSRRARFPDPGGEADSRELRAPSRRRSRPAARYASRRLGAAPARPPPPWRMASAFSRKRRRDHALTSAKAGVERVVEGQPRRSTLQHARLRKLREAWWGLSLPPLIAASCRGGPPAIAPRWGR